MHARGMVEEPSAGIAGRRAVEVSIGALHKRSRVGAFAILEMIDWRERSGRRQLEDHSVDITDGPRPSGSVKVAVRAGDQKYRVRFVLRRDLKIVKRCQDAILPEF